MQEILEEFNNNCTYDIFTDKYIHKDWIGYEGEITKEWYYKEYIRYLENKKKA